MSNFEERRLVSEFLSTKFDSWKTRILDEKPSEGTYKIEFKCDGWNPSVGDYFITSTKFIDLTTKKDYSDEWIEFQVTRRSPYELNVMMEQIEDEKCALLKAFQSQMDALAIAYNTQDLILERRRQMIEMHIECEDVSTS